MQKYNLYMSQEDNRQFYLSKSIRDYLLVSNGILVESDWFIECDVMIKEYYKNNSIRYASYRIDFLD